MEDPSFSFSVFQQALATSAVGRVMLYRASTATTMTLARREADEGAPHGTIVLAEEQTAGRGRRGRAFASPPDENLYFTLVLRLPIDVHRRLPLILPLAVTDALAQQGVAASIKWPNDIWANTRKLCGMLIDAGVANDGCLALAGIGINVNGDPTQIPELAGLATSARLAAGHPLSRETLLAEICNRIEAMLAWPAVELTAAYRERSMILGYEVLVEPAGEEPYVARALAVDDDGGLRIRRGDGREESVLAADVSVRPA